MAYVAIAFFFLVLLKLERGRLVTWFCQPTKSHTLRPLVKMESLLHMRTQQCISMLVRRHQNPKRRVDVSLMETQKVQAEENRELLRCTVLAVEYLAKQGLSFRGHRDDKVDYSVSDANRGNFIALLQLMAKGNMVLQKHLSLVSKNARYTSKTIQNEIIHIYSCAIKEKLTRVLKEKGFPFTVIADEVTDPHANQEILSVCIRFFGHFATL